MAPSTPLKRLFRLVWGDWQTNQLWQRIVKCSVAYMVALIVAIHPAVVPVFGGSTFLTVQTAVFAHPGQRMGKMIESLLMVVFGGLFGLAWSLLGLFLSSLVVQDSQPGAYAIRALFFLVAILFHGFVRSSSPRLFAFVLIMLTAAILVLLGKPATASVSVFTNVAYPILAGAAILLAVNLLIFPELSSSFLGSSTIDTLSQTMDTLTRATHWFVTPGGDGPDPGGLEPTNSGSKRSGVPLKQERTKRKGRLQHPPDDVASLTDRKGKLRAQMDRCRSAQDEVNFEISISSLPPSSMKPISTRYMASLVQNIVTVVGACENKFIVLGRYDRIAAQQGLDPDIDHDEEDPRVERAADSGQASSSERRGKQKQSAPAHLAAVFREHIPGISAEDKQRDVEENRRRVEDVKPLREFEESNAHLLESLLARLRGPVQDFEKSLQEAVALLTSCLAYCFDVSTLPSGTPTPAGIPLEEIDLRIDVFTDALEEFDLRSTEGLRQVAADERGQDMDIMPRMETFLASSFLLGFRQAATHILQMLRHARGLVETRRRRRDRLRVWFPHHTSIKQWLSTAGESDALVLPSTAKKSARRGNNGDSTLADGASGKTDDEPSLGRPIDEETPADQSSSKKSPHNKMKATTAAIGQDGETGNGGWRSKARNKAADAIEWAQDSEDLVYALKLAIAVFVVSWPALVSSWHSWYSEIRGTWAPSQLVLVFEVVIGSSLFIFFVRLFGVIFGCTFGYLSYVIAGGNRAAMVGVLLFGVVPSVYIQLATKFVKAGMVAVISMTVVALATVNASGTAIENFYTRLGAFAIGGSVAVLVEVVIYPVRARDRLVESLSTTVKQVQNMHGALAVGIDGPEVPDFRAEALETQFYHARSKAQSTLSAAETFLPFCLTEPRIKGSFKPLEPIYREIIYVLHQIMDRMDSVSQLRKEYGSSILENLNPQVYPYRRNVAASGALMLFSVNEALTTWLPLPQFIPSARLAQVRMISRVREVLASQGSRRSTAGVPENLVGSGDVDEDTARVITQRKFLSWNASTAGQTEIIEYLEELIELVKLLVGVNAFRSGMLEKPNYKQYLEQTETEDRQNTSGEEAPSAPTDTSATGEEAAAAMDGESGPDPGLRRTATVALHVERIRERLKKNLSRDANAYEGDDEDFIPRSLQRVGTRIRQENAAVRRRGFGPGDE